MSESFYVPPDVREPSRFSGYQIFRNKILISTNPRNITLVRSYGECAAMCTADERGCYSVNVRQIPESEDLWKCELFWMATYSDSDLSLSIGDLYLVLDKMYYWRDWDTDVEGLSALVLCAYVAFRYCVKHMPCSQATYARYMKRFRTTCTGSDPAVCRHYAIITSTGASSCSDPPQKALDFWDDVSACCERYGGC
ncbi:hypothetical protein LSH36_820g00033 [Paralvinella palmiformis]|uniref:lysozyme n=1 Tax=Paralvinella palmiformis TaxID=53620 RepID=A0AAD9MTW3_9ANNE|nr:hypothetical protein LSH36_820g00033 [Paralvinella palmiformis]